MKRKNLFLGAVTGVLIGLSTLLLNEGIVFSSTIGEKSITNSKNISEPVPAELKRSLSIEDKKKKAIEINQIGKEAETSHEDWKEGNDFYEKIKYRINIKREDAKQLFHEKILESFGDSLMVTDKDMFFEGPFNKYSNDYQWSIWVIDSKSHKNYWCVLSAITGKCFLIYRVDTKGLQSPEDAVYMSKIETKMGQDQLKHYTELAKYYARRDTMLSLVKNEEVKTEIEQEAYWGIRPTITIGLQDSKTGNWVSVYLYTDTGELIGYQRAMK